MPDEVASVSLDLGWSLERSCLISTTMVFGDD